MIVYGIAVSIPIFSLYKSAYVYWQSCGEYAWLYVPITSGTQASLYVQWSYLRHQVGWLVQR